MANPNDMDLRRGQDCPPAAAGWLAVSLLFHPLLMATYGMAMALELTYLDAFPRRLKCWLAGSLFLMTAAVPALFTFLSVCLGRPKGGRSRAGYGGLDRPARTLPYLVSATSLLAAAFYLHRMMMPFWLAGLFLGAAAALVVALLVNMYWKISAHCIGTGGMVGGIMGVAQWQMGNPSAVLAAAFLAAGAVGTARLMLGRHTPMQVYAGFALGFVCLYISSMLSYLYLFI